MGSGFVGRGPELAGLKTILEQAAGGRGQLVLVGGEPGIGKTRLVEEAAASAQGFSVSWGRCWEGGAAHPYWPWIQILREVDPAAEPLAALEGAPLPGGDPLARLRLFDATAQALRTAALAQPRVLAIDDLQWADAASRLLLAFLAPLLAGMRLVVLATYRTGERAEPLRPAHVIELGGLSEDEVGALVAPVSAETANAEVARRIYARSGGNPLFAGELARVVGLPGTLPATVRAVLESQLDRLSPQHRLVLEVAALFGETFATAQVAEVAGLALPDTLAALDEARRVRLIATIGASQATFAHDLVRESLIAGIPAHRAAELHRRAGEALEAVVAHQPALAADAARHFAAAPGAQAAGKAVRYARQAADRCMARFAYEEASRLYGQAREAAARTNTPEDSDLVRCLAGALLAAGDTAASRAAYIELAEAARAADDGRLLAEAALGMGSGPAGFEVSLLDHDQIATVHEALRLLGDEPSALRSQLLARLSVALTYAESDAGRVGLAEQALSVAREVGDPQAVAGALAAHCDALGGPDHVASRLAETEEMLGLAIRLEDEQLELMARRMRVVALLECGRLPEFAQQVEAYARSAAARYQPLYGWYVPMWRASESFRMGRLDDVRRHLAHLESLAGRTGSYNAFLAAAGVRWWLDLATGDADDVARMIAETDLTQVPGTWPVITLARSLVAVGRLDEARACLDQFMTLLGSAPRDSEWLPMLGAAAEAVWLLGGHPVAQQAYGALLPYRDLQWVEGSGSPLRGSLERPLGLLAAALGRTDDAVAHLEAAATRDRALASPFFEHEALRLLREIQTANPSRPSPGSALVRLDGKVWTLGYAGREVRLPDSKGIRDLAQLLAAPGRSVAALDLVTASAGAGAAPRAGTGPDELPGTPGDLGEALDATGREAFRRRLRDLEVEIDDAHDGADLERAARAQAERDAVLEALQAAYGLGGRPRHLGHPAERARSTVTARIRHAIGQIEGSHPELGRHLRHAVKTGAWCRYDPEEPVAWTVTLTVTKDRAAGG